MPSAESSSTSPIHDIAPSQGAASGRPLVIDLDGTLVRSDMLIESAFALLGKAPLSLFGMLRALCGGKAALKHFLASDFAIDPSRLPYDDSVLEQIKLAKEEGRPTYLASASNERIVSSIAKHVGGFTGWFASDANSNLSGEKKAQRLVEAFGEGGFDYIGNEAADLPIWERAAKRIAIRVTPVVYRRLKAIDPEATQLPSAHPTVRNWLKLLRVHQYVKNTLVFVALLTAHAFTLDAFSNAFLAWVAFSLCASSVYVLNDLLDLAADREHPTKRYRPLTAGIIPLIQGIIAVPVLLAAAFAVASQVSLLFFGILLGYFALTSAYSLYLKRKLLIDVVVLAGLYAIRVLAGAIAINVVASEWLLVFSMFIFASLALIKRYVELKVISEASPTSPANRGYHVADIEVIPALAAAAGFNAVTIFALYLTSEGVRDLYSHPQLLWLVCPLLLYWIGRALMIAHRGQMHDDPLVFALKDRVSLGTVFLIGALMVIASI